MRQIKSLQQTLLILLLFLPFCVLAEAELLTLEIGDEAEQRVYELDELGAVEL